MCRPLSYTNWVTKQGHLSKIPTSILPDLPHNTRGFTEEERCVAQLRMTEDVGVADSDEPGQTPFTGLIMALKDAKVYLIMFTLTAYVVGLSFNAFFPTLTGTLGFDYVFAYLVSLLNAWHSDRTQDKHITGPILLGLIGFIISMSTLNASSYASFIVFYSWISSSFPRPPAKRAVAIAMINAFSQLPNVAGSYVWDLKENTYRKSCGIVTAMFGVTIAGCWVFKMVLVRMNSKLDKDKGGVGEVAAAAPVEGDRRDPESMNKGFRYLV
ncbi:hypothetical protein C8A01DRAFT_43379 [Parachaetomium inaequale]|uniref:Uncharacterized protein n=1 Tax=Parachaetomium inaequale TaxID=2588326 RepID=A0AAN6PML2_9PEZI|nr:hypothetical protein C8A01DRAFT_43379 [Parachaetomium inaequale]